MRQLPVKAQAEPPADGGMRPGWVSFPAQDVGYLDAYCTLHGYEAGSPSWTWKAIAGHDGGWRLDHIFLSAELIPVFCQYHHDWREQGLSDHSALETDFEHCRGVR